MLRRGWREEEIPRRWWVRRERGAEAGAEGRGGGRMRPRRHDSMQRTLGKRLLPALAHLAPASHLNLPATFCPVPSLVPASSPLTPPPRLRQSRSSTETTGTAASCLEGNAHCVDFPPSLSLPLSRSLLPPPPRPPRARAHVHPPTRFPLLPALPLRPLLCPCPCRWPVPVLFSCFLWPSLSSLLFHVSLSTLALPPQARARTRTPRVVARPLFPVAALLRRQLLTGIFSSASTCFLSTNTFLESVAARAAGSWQVRERGAAAGKGGRDRHRCGVSPRARRAHASA